VTAASEASGREAFGAEACLVEVQSKLDRHQRELLQRLNFQDEVLSLLLVAKPPEEARMPELYQEQRRPPELTNLATDVPRYQSKGTSRQASNGQLDEQEEVAMTEDFDVDVVDASCSRQATADKEMHKEAVLINVQQQLDRVGSASPRIFRTQSQKEEAMRQAASAKEMAEAEPEPRRNSGRNVDCETMSSMSGIPSRPTRRSLRQKMPQHWEDMSAREKLQHVVQSPYFELFFSICICSNAVVLGIDVQHFANERGPAPVSLEVIGHVYAILFLVELLARLAVHGGSFFTDPKNWTWNLIDLIVVASAMVEMTIQVALALASQDAPPGVHTLSNLRVLRIIRITRLVRLTRIARITRFIKALRTLVSSIVFTLKSLVWALVLLSLIIYGFGIIFTQAAILFLIETENGASDEVLESIGTYWIDLPASMLTLFMSISGGLSWEAALRPMSEVSPWCAFLFLFYIAFSYFAVLNVVTGVFCQSAIESAQGDHDMIMQNIIQNKEAHIRKVKSLFTNLDADDSGYISLVELEENMHKKSVRTYFEALELDVADAWTFFKLLDTDGGAAIEIEEFLLGCLRLRGPAKALDLARMQHDQQWMANSLGTFMGHVEVALRKLEAGLLKLCELQLESHYEGFSAGNSNAGDSVYKMKTKFMGKDAGRGLHVPPPVIHKVPSQIVTPDVPDPPELADDPAVAPEPQADTSPAPSSEHVTHINHVIVPRGAEEHDTSVLICESRAEQL